jgi:hypothetical protein
MNPINLEVVAASLPKMAKPVIRTGVVSGRKLLAMGQTEYKGEPINPKKFYQNVKLVVDYKPINHLREIKRIYKHKGRAGVAAYQRKIMDAYRKHNAA